MLGSILELVFSSFCSLESQILVGVIFPLPAARINNCPRGKDSGLEVVAVLFKSRAS